jgi:hypothetical protein
MIYLSISCEPGIQVLPPPFPTLIQLPSSRLESTQLLDSVRNGMIESMRWEGVQLAVSLHADQSDHSSEQIQHITVIT